MFARVLAWSRTPATNDDVIGAVATLLTLVIAAWTLAA